MSISRLNHAVLFVRNAESSAEFYQDVFGFEIAAQLPGAVFMRSPLSNNDHDLGLFSIGENAASAPRGQNVGLYHLAWQVETLRDLKEMSEKLMQQNSYTGASDHGASKSVYGKDPDGIEFEVMWAVPSELMGENDELKTVPLNIDLEIANFGADTPGRKLTI